MELQKKTTLNLALVFFTIIPLGSLFYYLVQSTDQMNKIQSTNISYFEQFLIDFLPFYYKNGSSFDNLDQIFQSLKLQRLLPGLVIPIMNFVGYFKYKNKANFKLIYFSVLTSLIFQIISLHYFFVFFNESRIFYLILTPLMLVVAVVLLINW